MLDGLIAERLGAGPKRILELGAGGGHTLVHLAAEADGGYGKHECVAVDLAEPMLVNCRALIPGVEAVAGDMRTVRLDQQFDVVLIHDAIDYLLTPEDVRQTLETVREHLAPGGLAFIAPTYTRETFTDGEVADDGTTTGAENVTYFSYIHDPDPADDTFEMILLYLIRPQNKNHEPRAVETIEDRHTLGLFAEAQWIGWMRDAGLATEHVGNEDGAWSLFVGTK